MYTCRPSCLFSKNVQSSYSAKNLSVELAINIKCIWKNHPWLLKLFSPRYCVDSVKHIQHPLFRILQKYQKDFDSGRFTGTILMDLPKVYDCLSHDFSIAKLEAYGLGNDSLNFLLDYLTFRKQKTKANSACSKWSKIRRGIPQGSILGLNLFNIFINDIFMIIEQSAICNFADDNTLYSW